MAASGGARGAGMAALAKVLAVCAGTAGGTRAPRDATSRTKGRVGGCGEAVIVRRGRRGRSIVRRREETTKPRNSGRSMPMIRLCRNDPS